MSHIKVYTFANLKLQLQLQLQFQLKIEIALVSIDPATRESISFSLFLTDSTPNFDYNFNYHF